MLGVRGWTQGNGSPGVSLTSSTTFWSKESWPSESQQNVVLWGAKGKGGGGGVGGPPASGCALASAGRNPPSHDRGVKSRPADEGGVVEVVARIVQWRRAFAVPD